MTAAKPGDLTGQDLLQEKLRTAISLVPVRPFLVKLRRPSASSAELNVHVAKETTQPPFYAKRRTLRSIRRDFSRAMSAQGLEYSIRLKFHGRRVLDQSRSLEEFVSQFGHGERLYDPAGVFEETECLVQFACELRRRLGPELKGVYWSSRRHTTCVLLDEHGYTDGYYLRRDKLTATERTVIDCYKTSVGTSPPSTHSTASRVSTVSLCFKLPAEALVPVDSASVIHRRSHASMLAKRLDVGTLARIPILSALIGVSSAGVALAKLPPVKENPLYVATDLIPGQHQPLIRAPANSPPTSEVAPDNQAVVGRDEFFELVNSGTTFASASSMTHVELKWTSDDERTRPGAHAIAGSARADSVPVMRPALAAVIGLASLLHGDLSDESHADTLEDLRLYFGLPWTLQAAASEHYERIMHSSIKNPQREDFLRRKELLGRTDAYWELLRRIIPVRRTGAHEQNFRRYFDSPLEAMNRRRRGSSS